MFNDFDLENDSTRVIFNTIKDNEQEINNLIDTINSNIATINNDLTSINSNIDTLSIDTSKMHEDINKINNTISAISSIQNKIAEISNSLSSAEDNISKIINYTTSNNITMSELISLKKYQLNSHLCTNGYYVKDDGGAAEYVISNTKYNWSIELTDSDAETKVYANIINTDHVNYKMFGAQLNGSADDTSAMQKAHSYANAYNIPVKNNSGIIYKPNNTTINITSSSIDLTGSRIKLNSSVAGTVYNISDSNTAFKGGVVDIEGFSDTAFTLINASNSTVTISDFIISAFDGITDTNSYNFSLIKLSSCSKAEIKNIKSLGSITKLKENIKCKTLEIISSQNVTIDNCDVLGYSEVISLSKSKFIDIFNSSFNILDLSDNNSAVTIKKCTFKNKGIILGEGKDFLNIKDSEFIKINNISNSSSSVINFNFSKGKIFNGKINLENVSIQKENVDMSLFNLAYTTSAPVDTTNNIKLPDITLKDIKIINKETGTSKFILFNLSGNSSYSTASSKIRKFNNITIDNISYSNPDSTIGNIILLSDTSTKDMYSVNNFSCIKILNTVFSSDLVSETITGTSDTTITLENAVGNNISINTSSVLFSNTKLILDNVKTNLKNSNKDTSLYINNSALYAFSQDAIIPAFINTIINNSTLRIFNCSIIDNKCTIPIGAYNTCFFNTYKYTKSADTTVYTCTISKSADAKVLNSNI